jgi:peptidoglycan/LPS O-acetylase OafA/YrhL
MSKENTGERSEIFAVQYLRALAALLVVYMHTKVYTEQFSWPAPRDFGASGVDLFFVISGFIMMVITARRPPRPGEFLLRRAIRIAPLYWLVTLAILAVGLLWPAAMLHNMVTFEHVALSLLFIPHFNPLEGSYAPFFKLGWTLNYEIYFYLVFAALLAIASIGLRLAALSTVFLVSAAFYLTMLPTNPLLHTFGNPIILEFLIGAVIGALYLRGRLQVIGPRAAMALLVGGLFFMSALFDTRDFERVGTAGFGAAAVMLALLSLELRGRLRSWPLLILLGDASYSIYLAHPLVLTLARLGARTIGLPVEQIGPGMLAVMMTMAIAVAAGVAAHLWIERPMLDWLRSRLLAPASARAATTARAVRREPDGSRRICSAGALVSLLAVILACSHFWAFPPSPARADSQRALRIVHEEDFSRADRLDEDFWTYEIGFIRNHEQQYYRASNVFVRDGALTIEGRVEGVANAAFDPDSQDWTRASPLAEFTSGSIVSRRPLRYGAVEIVARAPAGAGTWPAIWMLGAEGRPYREIDILEAVGQQPDLVFTSFHAGPSLDRLTNWSAKTNVPGLATQWHVYRLDWSAERIAVSIDGREALALDPSGAGEALRRPMHLRINLALGGEWGHEVDRSALPARFEIRSIRIFSDGA